MKTIILPGYSPSNKDWAEETKNRLPELNIEIHEWQHWKDESAKFNVVKELEKIKKEVGESKVNIIAKSIGTFILANLLEESGDKINKLILCGICKNDLNSEELQKYNSLKNFDASKVLVFQNKGDRHGSFEEVKEFLAKINPEIKIMEKPGDTHDYPYFDDFKKFLS